MPFTAGSAWEIQSLVSEKPVVGKYPPLPPQDGPGPVILSEPIHINGTGIWGITPKDDSGIYQLSITGFDYIGISDKNVVIATNTAEENRLWYIKEVGINQFIIALADDSTLGWTVDGLNPDANIVVASLPPPDVPGEALPNPFYHLFDIHGLLQK